MIACLIDSCFACYFYARHYYKYVTFVRFLYVCICMVVHIKNKYYYLFYLLFVFGSFVGVQTWSKTLIVLSIY